MHAELFSRHIEEKFAQFLTIMEETGWEHLLLSSGSELIQFRDDMGYPFKVNPYFKEWLPLTQRPNCFLLISELEKRPRLFLKEATDIWHTAPEQLPAGFEQAVDVCHFHETKELFAKLPKDTRHMAYIGPKMTAMSGVSDEQRNPQSLMNRIDWLRAVKSPYEQSCIREANRIAARGHKAAEMAFRAGKSENEILLDYLVAVKCSDRALPYEPIMALNENAAVLHHNRLGGIAPDESRSFLIDAGVDVNGYASDISRTYATDDNTLFAAIIQALDEAQQQLIARITPGVSYVTLHQLAHQKVAEVLKEFEVFNCSVEQAQERGLTSVFFPHGLGHFLGVQVHDKGGHQAAPQGGDNPPPLEHPYLRLTRTIEVGQVFTVEPGIYFIPSLLKKAREGEFADSIDWGKVDELLPYGGIRIEDNILVTESGAENLTRQAFSEH